MFSCGLSTTRMPSPRATRMACRTEALVGVRAGSGAIAVEVGSGEYQVARIATLSLPSAAARASEPSEAL
jgi:hypothetical protein